MSFIRFNVFGKLVAIGGQQGAWSTWYLSLDGKRRPADFEIPDFLQEDEICQFLEDIFHESAMPWNGNVQRLNDSSG